MLAMNSEGGGMIRVAALALGGLLGLNGAARADITIGAILSITGPVAAQGVGYKNAFDFLPTEIGGQKVTYLIRDDGNDPTAAVTIARKLISEDHVDAIIGPASVGPSSAVMPVTNEAHVVNIMLQPAVFDAKANPYTFDDVQPAQLMIEGVVKNMQSHGAKTVGFIGYSDGWGDQVLGALKTDVSGSGIEIIDEERYARTDTSVQPQVLKAMSKHPDVMMLGGSAVPGALPQIALVQRGYKGQVYNNHGVVSADYIRVGGAAVEGCIAPTGPLVVYDQLTDDNPVKPVATKFMESYVAKFGPQSRNAFAGYTYDAGLLLQAGITAALAAKTQPGTEEFRSAIRQGIEHVSNLVGTHGVYTMKPDDHNGMDSRAMVLVQIQSGAWKLLK
jgi:branched-chain amino acid transport system substrate-binding protein